MTIIDNRGKDKERGPRSEIRAEVETAFAIPKTLQAQTEMMPFSGATIAMYAVYGRDDKERKVWCATFIDSDEAMAWVMSSKTFGRPVMGAVIAKQPGVTDGTGTDSGEPADKPN